MPRGRALDQGRCGWHRDARQRLDERRAREERPVWRTVFGVLLLALLQNALNLLDVAPYWQQILSGVIILIAIVINTLSSRATA